MRSSAKVIHAIKFWKAVLIKEWHTSSSPNKYEYSGVLFCYDKSLDQLALIESTELKAYGIYIAHREQQRFVQFLMAFQSDFEGIRGSIWHRFSLPSIDWKNTSLVLFWKENSFYF